MNTESARCRENLIYDSSAKINTTRAYRHKRQKRCHHKKTFRACASERPFFSSIKPGAFAKEGASVRAVAYVNIQISYHVCFLQKARAPCCDLETSVQRQSQRTSRGGKPTYRRILAGVVMFQGAAVRLAARFNSDLLLTDDKKLLRRLFLRSQRQAVKQHTHRPREDPREQTEGRM